MYNYTIIIPMGITISMIISAPKMFAFIQNQPFASSFKELNVLNAHLRSCDILWRIILLISPYNALMQAWNLIKQHLIKVERNDFEE